MTETGRDVVERLRRELREARYLEPFDLDTQDALLDLVEAAQEYIDYENGKGPGGISGYDEAEAGRLYNALEDSLAALHSQASDEGKA